MKQIKLSMIITLLLILGYFIHSIVYGMTYPSSHYPWSDYTPTPKLLGYTSAVINSIIFMLFIPTLNYMGINKFSQSKAFFKPLLIRVSFVILYTGFLFMTFKFLFGLFIVGCD